MNIYISEIADVVKAVEFTPTQEAEEKSYPIVIPRGATAFVVGVGREEGRVFSRPENVTVSLLRNNEPISPNDENATFSGESLVSYMTGRPSSGEWSLKIEHTTSEPFLVSAAVFRKPVQSIISFTARHRCKACKASLRALIFALLAKLTAGTVAALDIKDFAAEIMRLPIAILDFLSHTIGVSSEWLKDLFGELGDIFGFETPWSWLARRICEKLGLCVRGARADD
jgi:hypothetical protein